MKFERDLSFDDVLLNPKFSFVESRKEIKLESKFLALGLKLPIISANMDTITAAPMANAMTQGGAIGCLHRFMDIQENVEAYKRSPAITMGSVGIGDEEYERAIALADAGCVHLVIDVAHGASIAVVRQYDLIRKKLKNNVSIIVGNFANGQSIKDFISNSSVSAPMDAAKMGVGGGSMCTTRLVTGCGRSTLSSILSARDSGISLIADGGIRNSGDVFKSLAAGASAVMIGGMLAGTEETPGEFNSKVVYATPHQTITVPVSKTYRGSASKESYEVQGKTATHRTPEGESTTVSYKGPVKDVLQTIEAGIRSGMSYIGADRYERILDCAEFIEISNSTIHESSAHGKK